MLAQTRNNLGWGLIERAEAYVVAGDLETARSLVVEARSLDPAYPEVLNNQATQLLQQGDAAAAIPKYKLALLMQPGHARVRTNLALALAAGGRVDEALAEAREAQRALPDDPGLAQLISRLEQAHANP
ncbi:MAG: tetratricopeptide repeat protein [Candidatus Latescibacterota bacterium]|nr:MAG: tetratricopeptide repeat protein [Candidatus Latescibacterota bacterium]